MYRLYFRSLISGFLLCIVAAAPPRGLAATGSGSDCVILLHGMGRSAWSMSTAERALTAEGFVVINDGYPSTSESIPQLAERYIGPAVRQCQQKQAQHIHFVTHSLGGIVLRQYLQNNSLPDGSRIVMLAPPNQGSELAEHFKEFFLYRWVMGPAGQALGNGGGGIVHELRPLPYDVGIIAGNKSWLPFLSERIPGPDDGVVAVETTRLPEMTDFLVVPETHTFIMRDAQVLDQVLHFLRHGRFVH